MPISALLLAAATVAAVATPAPATVADPLAPARKGLIECFQPNEKAHICRALSRYVENKDGSWQTTTTMLLLPNRPLTMETQYVARMEGNAVCSSLDKPTLDAAKLRVGGEPLPEDRVAMVHERLEMVLGATLGKKECASYLDTGNGLLHHGTIDGQPTRAAMAK